MFIAFLIVSSAEVSIAGNKQVSPDNMHNARYYFDIGVLSAGQKNYKEAVKGYTQAMKLQPDYVDAYVGLGKVYESSGMFRAALDTLEYAVKIDPGCAEAYNHLGLAYEKPNMYQRAISAFKHALKIKPDFAEARYNLAAAYLVLNDRGSALKEYDILRDMDAELAHELIHRILE